MSLCFSLLWTACRVLRLPHKSDRASTVSAVATSASTVVLLVGAFLARRYVTRVTATVEASGFTRPDGVLIIVRPCIQSAGLSPLVINQDVDTAADVTVSERQWRGEDFETGEKAVTLGWKIVFTFAIKRVSLKDRYWWWEARTFVAPPELDRSQHNAPERVAR